MLDKSESTYISGDHINITMSMNNLSLGVNNIGIGFGTPISGGLTSQSIIDELPFVFGNPYYQFGFQYTQGALSILGTAISLIPSYSDDTFPINITDLGTQKGIDNSNQWNNPIPGNTIKGNYSGTVYACDTMYLDYSNPPGYLRIYEFNTPTQISIDFEAIREY